MRPNLNALAKHEWLFSIGRPAVEFSPAGPCSTGAFGAEKFPASIVIDDKENDFLPTLDWG
jgi:hypothetical protein